MRRLPLFALSLLALPALWCGPARAADKADFKIRFNTAPTAEGRKEGLLLRPNQVLDYFVFVENASAKDEEVTLDVLAGGKVIEGGSKTFTAKANDATLVKLGMPPPPAGDKPAPPAAPDKAAPPPALVELPGEVKFVLSAKDAAGKRVELTAVDLVVARPSTYIEVAKAEYDPRPQAGGKIKNQLRVTLRAGKDFQGGTCRVELVLDPTRIPVQNDAKHEGTRGGKLERAGDEVTLTANNLQFVDAAGQTGKKDGFVYITIDGYERAVIFTSTFPRTGDTISKLDRDDSRVFARLRAPHVADPGKPYQVEIELDNAGAANVLELGLNRDADPANKFKRNSGELIVLGHGDRQEKLFVNAAFPGGALQLKRTVADWSTALDVAGINGRRDLRFRLLSKRADFDKDSPELVKFFNAAEGPGGQLISELTQEVLFDGNRPTDLRFVDFPKTLVRGSALPVKAVVPAPESGIKEVLFYVGKPGPDGKMPPNSVTAPGTLADPKTDLWVAALDAPTDQKGKADVTAQVTSNTGLVATETVTIKLVDAGPNGGGGGKGGTIEGAVVQGDRLQPDVPVFLRDAAGGVKDTTVTDKKGAYSFKDVPPGTYRVFAKKNGDNTKGETIVQVQEGQKKVDVGVSLLR